MIQYSYVSQTVLQLFFSFLLLITTSQLRAQYEAQNCTYIGRYACGPCYCVTVADTILYFGNGGYLEILDISDPENPVELSDILTPGGVWDVTVRGNYAYIANGFCGLRVIDINYL